MNITVPKGQLSGSMKSREVTKLKLVADLHVHTIASGHGYSSLEETARVAAGRGMQAIAITEHGPSLPGAPGPTYFNNMWVLHDQVEGIEILRGIEANVLYGGLVDLDDPILARLDLVLAGFHLEARPAGSVEDNTADLITAISHPLVDVVTHPENPQFPIDFGRLVDALVAHGKVLEINNNSPRVRTGSDEYAVELAQLAVQRGCRVMVNSDCHFSYDVGEFGWGYQVLERAGVPEDLVVNASMEGIRRLREERERRVAGLTRAGKGR